MELLPKRSGGQQDESVDKGAGYQARQPEFAPQEPHGRSELTSGDFSHAMEHAIFPQINDCNFFKKRRKKKSTEKAGSWLGRPNTHHARTRTIIWDPTIHKAGQCTCDPSAREGE